MAAKKNLVIVESPAKAKTIGKYLGPDYVVKASMGHLRDLPKSTLGVDVEGDFTPNYRPIKGKEDIIKDLKTTADKSKTVYLATDPDREGEAISWHLQHLLDLPDDKARRVMLAQHRNHLRGWSFWKTLRRLICLPSQTCVHTACWIVMAIFNTLRNVCKRTDAKSASVQ